MGEIFRKFLSVRKRDLRIRRDSPRGYNCVVVAISDDEELADRVIMLGALVRISYNSA